MTIYPLRGRPRLTAAATVVALVVAAGAAIQVPANAAIPDATITVDNGTQYQTVAGFGASLVDQVGNTPGNPLDLYSMGAAQQQQILDLLFNQTSGAGLSILRFELGAGNFYGAPDYTIEPTNPGSPTAAPVYQWDHSADHQVDIAKQAQSRGVNTFYADAWSAPAFMKDNNSVANGGTLCGEASCNSGDWRNAYASYLVQYLRDYAGEGIPVTMVDPMNEPTFSANYQSMLFTANQAADFIKILGPALTSAGLPTKIACCDNSGFSEADSYQNTILADPTAASYEAVAASHGYGGDVSAITAATKLGKPTWETENTCIFDTWNTAYSGGNCPGQYLADHIYNTMTGGAATYLAWTGNWDHTDNEDLIRNLSSTNYQVSSRLWALANYARYIRPGAARIDAASSDGNMMTTAYRNTDGSFVIVIDNHNTTTKTAAITGLSGGTATPYVTNDAGGMQQQAAIGLTSSGLVYSVPPTSTVTLRITNSAPPGIPVDGEYKVLNVNSGLPLGITDSSLNDGAQANQFHDYNVPSQKWTLSSIGAGRYKILNVNSGKALGINDSSLLDGAHANQFRDYNLPAQQWTVTKLSNGHYKIVSINSGKPLGVEDNRTDNGAPINQFSYYNVPSQQWDLTPTS